MSLWPSEPWVCPQCGVQRAGPKRGEHIARCPTDGRALVTQATLTKCPNDPFLGLTIAERFTITDRLGSGAMGTVYKAWQEAMGRFVAIKILRSDRALDAQAKSRFVREAKAMSLLKSPHTVTVFDFGELPDPGGDDAGMGGSLYLVMELLEGESLGQRVKRQGRMSVRESLTVTRDALRSLHEAHEKGIVHRDLKPDNLFLVRDTSSDALMCKVLDFGIAKMVTASSEGVDALATQAGTVFGTPRYMSPEQAQGKALDGRSDLYSLGVILYQMLVGVPPFVDDDAVVVMARHIKTIATTPHEAIPEAGIPLPVSDLVMHVLEKDPAKRPESARAFLTQVELLLQAFAHLPDQLLVSPHGSGEVSAVVSADLTGARPSARPWALRSGRGIALAGAGVMVVGAAVLGIVASTGAPHPSQAEAGVGRAAAAIQPGPLLGTEAASAQDVASQAVPTPSASVVAAAASADSKPKKTPHAKPARKPEYRRFE